MNFLTNLDLQWKVNSQCLDIVCVGGKSLAGGAGGGGGGGRGRGQEIGSQHVSSTFPVRRPTHTRLHTTR